MKTVLFLCTGNFYRSRFAEILFNARAGRAKLNWRADSRGLKTEGWGNLGPLSEHSEKRLAEIGVSCETARRMPKECSTSDLEAASLVIALKEAEHRGMLAKRFAGWEDRVTYWHVHDLDAAEPPEALAAIESLVDELISKLAKRNGSV